MTFQDILNLSLTIIASLGGGAVIVFGFSSFLGKIWADRLMVRERAEHATQLEHLRTELKQKADRNLAELSANLDFAKDALTRDRSDKVHIYRASIDLIATISAKLTIIIVGGRSPLSSAEIEEFETERLRVYAYLAMHAPQYVMDANDRLTDLILAVMHNERQSTWDEFRTLALNLLNAIRKDLGINLEPIEYRGER